jgi:hypothetical protein
MRNVGAADGGRHRQAGGGPAGTPSQDFSASAAVGEIGYTVAAEAASIDEALEATRKTEFDLATWTPISMAGPSRQLPMPSSPVT